MLSGSVSLIIFFSAPTVLILCYYEQIIVSFSSMCYSLAVFFFSDCTYIRTDETDETASGSDFDSFESGFGFSKINEKTGFGF